MDVDDSADPIASGCAVQIVKLDMANRKVEVDEDALGQLEQVFRSIGSHKVAVVTVMGALRTGKSFLLDLFLRYLRHGAFDGEPTEPVPPRGGDEEFPLPSWITAAGDRIQGGNDQDVQSKTAGFRYRAGMDACTEGIWVWSKPFLRTVNGKTLAVVLMDTQGAWDSSMTKEQSATIFGLTAVLSSKQIYNISMQIQEDKVENLGYFMSFAQAALRRSGESSELCFQELDFLVRDWSHFRDNWTVEECRAQMNEHRSKMLDPTRVVENSTVTALNSMFQNIRCFCLPHPGLIIQKDTWSGRISDISNDFLRFADSYITSVFNENLDTKNLLGSDVTTFSLPMVIRFFVKAFAGAAPAAMTFTEAMTSATVLLAKEQAMMVYTTKMDEAMGQNLRGMAQGDLEALHRKASFDSKSEYDNVTIFGSDGNRTDAWTAIEGNLQSLFARYKEDNERRAEKALVAFANISLLGFCLFLLDLASNWVCDWWSQTCVDLSKLMMAAYFLIFVYIAFNVYFVFRDQGKLAVAVAGGELWKEMMRLLAVYSELAAKVKFSELPELMRKSKKE